MVFMTAMPLILTNVWQEGADIERRIHRAGAHFLGMSRLQILTKIYLPTILLPLFFAGVRLAFGFGAPG